MTKVLNNKYSIHFAYKSKAPKPKVLNYPKEKCLKVRRYWWNSILQKLSTINRIVFFAPFVGEVKILQDLLTLSYIYSEMINQS